MATYPTGTREYWIVNLVDGVLEVYRDPRVEPGSAGTWRYATRLILDRTSIAVPLAAPAARIRVADLVP